jgi:hypothetical protein
MLRSSCLDSSPWSTWARLWWAPSLSNHSSLCRWSGNILEAALYLYECYWLMRTMCSHVCFPLCHVHVHHLHLPRCKSSSTVNPAFANCLHAKAFTISNHWSQKCRRITTEYTSGLTKTCWIWDANTRTSTVHPSTSAQCPFECTWSSTPTGRTALQKP